MVSSSRVLRTITGFLSSCLVVILLFNQSFAATLRSFTLTYDVDLQSAREQFELINEWRTSGTATYKNTSGSDVSCGVLNAYTYDYTLEKIALQRAYEVAVKFGHSRPGGSGACTIDGVTAVGENCYVGSAGVTAEYVFTKFQENDNGYAGQGHRRNMLSSGFTAIGIACVTIGGWSYWTQEFGTKNSNAAATDAFVGTTTGTVTIDTSSADFSIGPAESFSSSLTYGDSLTLPEIKGYYVCQGENSRFHTKIEVPSSEVTDITWKSSDTSVLTIVGNNTVNAVGPGSATLTATAKFEGKTYTYETQVTVYARSISSSVITCTLPTVYFEPDGAQPKPTLTYNGKTLSEGTDYEITSYSSNTYVTSYAYVKITGKGNFSDTRTVRFQILARDISECTLEEIPDVYYTGTATSPALTLTYNGTTLTKGTNYTLSCTDNTEPGTATVTIKGCGYYTGERSATYKINKQIADNLTYSDIDEQQYTGAEITPYVTIRNGNKYLTKDTDYSIGYSNNTAVGEAAATVTFMGNYTGTKTLKFKIVPRQISSVYCYVYAKTYTGSAITQTLNLKNGSEVLVEGTDYKVTYKDNVNVGTATMTLTGLGNYTGTKDYTFAINPVNASSLSCKTNAPFVYTGSPIIPQVTLTYGDITFKENVDYTLSFSDNVEPGQGVITINGISSILTGTSTRKFTINAVNVNTLEIEDIPDQAYTGSAIKPSVVVKNGSVTLKEGTDYTLSYENNTSVTSYAYVYVTGMGHYTSSVTKRFKIVSSATGITVEKIADQEYTGSPIFPDVVVKAGTKILTNGTDYTLVCKDIVNAGTATVTVTLKGSYSGALTTTFKINPRSISKASISKIADQTYTGSEIKPSVTVTDNGKSLTSGKDFTVAYANNINAGTAKVTITGSGNYKDTTTVNFTIVKPTDPTDPTEPTDPTDPTDPTNPTDPDDPNDSEEEPVVTYRLKKIKGKYYCISSATGKKVKGWRTINGKTYYFNKKTGVMTKGWKKISGRKYYFSKSGVMTKGWKKIKGKKYYFASNGVMAKGWKTIGDHRYYFSKSGVMQKGFKKIGKYKYYFSGSGIMQTGWKKIHKKWYYFYPNGHMVKSKTIEIDGIKYKFKKSGVCTRKPVTTAPPASTTVNNETPPQTDPPVTETPVTEMPVTEPNGAPETPAAEPA